MVDLTHLEMSSERLFDMILRANQRGAFMGASLSQHSSIVAEARRNGLISKHAYTITKVVCIGSHLVHRKIFLVRLRNPWGDDHEWSGYWCDNDRNWQRIPNNTRIQLGLTIKADGEFYMSLGDFLKYFGTLQICHLSPGGLDVEDNHKRFDVFNFSGSWRAGTTAGGSINSGRGSFAMNPKYFINLSNPDPYGEIKHCSVVISIIQNQGRRKFSTAIGFRVFKVDLKDNKFDKRFFKRKQPISGADTFIELVEVSKRMLLPEGSYCIIPCTFKRGKEGDFFLRVFVEKHWGSSEEDKEKVVNGTMDSGVSKQLTLESKHRLTN